MEMDEKDNDRQEKLKGLWTDAKRYQEIHDEVREALLNRMMHHSNKF